MINLSIYISDISAADHTVRHPAVVWEVVCAGPACSSDPTYQITTENT